MPLGLARGTVQLSPYDPEWARLYEIEAMHLHAALGEHLIALEHIGSTSIPGISAKPILDIVAAVDTLHESECFSTLLQPHGYALQHDFRDTQQHLLYVKGSEERRTHYLKLTTRSSDFWNECVEFRDYLLHHPTRAQEYERLKQELLRLHADDRPSYTAAKANFIQETFRMAGR